MGSISPAAGRTASAGPARAAASWLHNNARVRLAALLSAPLAWLLFAYLGSLLVLFISAFWSVNDFTGDVIHQPTLDNFRTILSQPVYRTVALRSIGVAAAVTVIDTVVALPMAFFMAKVAAPRSRKWLVIAILTPLWASYLVKAYAWRVLLANGGPIDTMLGGPGHGPGYGLPATIIVLSYLWLPYMILPIYAGLERLPDSLAGGVGGSRRSRVAYVSFGSDADHRAGRFRGLDLHVLAISGRLHHRADRRRQEPTDRQPGVRQHRRSKQPASRRGTRDHPGPHHGDLSVRGPPLGRSGGVVTLSRGARWLLRAAMAVGLAVIYLPLTIVLINSFNSDRTFAWPPPGWTTRWWTSAWANEGARAALWTSVKAGLSATAIALVLGTMVAFAVARYRFFGRDSLSLLVVLPIALPGIVTGIALDTAFRSVIEPLGIGKGLFSIVIGHATFCVVVVYNNVLARLRRLGGNLEEASADLGAHTFQTFRLVTFPLLRSALFAGALLAFALSFDEIVVTTFTAGPGVQTLPIWIFSNLFRPNQAPVINVVASVLIVLSVIPVWLAQRMGGGQSAGGRL